jgi:hypothetical protein
MFGPQADLLSLLYVLAAAYTLWQLKSRWRGLVDAEYTADDRNLAGRIGFLLLTPLGVLIHELSHWTAAHLLGARDISLHFRFYWGFVQYGGRLGPAAEWIIASVGPGSSLVLGLLAGYVALRLRPPWRDVGLSFAHATLLLDLVLYPAVRLVQGVGDFQWIYTRDVPTLSVVAGVVHGLGLIAYVVMARLQSRQSRREARAALSEQFAGQQITLRPQIVARLDELERHERVRRLEPAEREELNQLRELREWSAEHNRALASGVAPPAGTTAPPPNGAVPPMNGATPPAPGPSDAHP